MKRSVYLFWCVLGFLVLIGEQASLAQTDDRREVISPENVEALSELAMLGHGLLWDAAWSADGGHIVVATSQGIWSLESETFEEEGLVFEQPVPTIRRVAMSSTRHLLATITDDDHVQIWEMTWRESWILAHEYNVAARIIAWSPDEYQIAIGLQNGGLLVSDWRYRDGTFPLSTDDSEMIDVAWSPDGQYVGAAYTNGNVVIWDVGSRHILHTLRGHVGVVRQIKWSPDGRLMATSGSDGSVRVWDAETTAEWRHLTVDGNPIWALDWSPDGQRIVAGDFAGRVYVWDFRNNVLVQSIAAHGRTIFRVEWSSDGQQVLTAGWDGLVQAWDSSSWTVSGKIIMGHGGPLEDMAWSPDNRRIASTGLDQAIWIWNLEDGSYFRLVSGLEGRPYRIWWSADGQSVFCVTWQRIGYEWDATSGEQIQTFNTARRGYSTVLSPDATQLAATQGSDVVVWDIDSQTSQQWTIQGAEQLFIVGWSPNGSRIALKNQTYSLIILTLATGSYVEIPSDGFYNRISWSPDSTQVAKNSFDTIDIYDATSGAWINTIETDTGSFGTVNWSPDASLLVLGENKSDRGETSYQLVFIRTDSYEKVHISQMAQSPIAMVRFSPDGRTMAIVHDTVIRVYGISR